MEKPKVDLVEGLSPTVSIDQKSTSHSARSTVGTLTEVSDFLRLLWSRLGTRAAPSAGRRSRRGRPNGRRRHARRPPGVAAMLLAPVVRERKGEYRKELAEWAQKGFVRARIDGVVRRLDEDIQLQRYAYHTIELVVDRLTITRTRARASPKPSSRPCSSAMASCALAYGDDQYRLFSTQRSCPNGHGALPELEPRLFSFNSPIGACPKCDGLGETFGFAPELLVQGCQQVAARRRAARVHRRRQARLRRLTIEHLAEVAARSASTSTRRGTSCRRRRRRSCCTARASRPSSSGGSARAAMFTDHRQRPHRVPGHCSATSRTSTGRRARATSTGSAPRCRAGVPGHAAVGGGARGGVPGQGAARGPATLSVDEALAWVRRSASSPATPNASAATSCRRSSAGCCSSPTSASAT
jgi:hypothetical protein